MNWKETKECLSRPSTVSIDQQWCLEQRECSHQALEYDQTRTTQTGRGRQRPSLEHGLERQDQLGWITYHMMSYHQIIENTLEHALVSQLTARAKSPRPLGSRVMAHQTFAPVHLVLVAPGSQGWLLLETLALPQLPTHSSLLLAEAVTTLDKLWMTLTIFQQWWATAMTTLDKLWRMIAAFQ